MLLNNIKNWFCNIFRKIDEFVDKPIFAVVLGLCELICYYLALDIFLIAIISLFLSFSFIFKKRLNCIFIIFLFMASMISYKNSPASVDLECNSEYFFNNNILIACVIFALLPIVSALYRLIDNFVKRKISISPFLISLFCLGIAFLANGTLIENYNFLNTMFGIFMVFFFAIVFLALLPNVEVNKEQMLNMSKQVSIYICVPLIELLIFYIFFSKNARIVDSRIDTFLGWGNNNTLGLLLTISFNFVVFGLANDSNKKNRIFYFVLCCLIVLGTIFTYSRQAYLALFLSGIALILFFIIRKNKISVKYIPYFIIGILLILFLTVVLFFACGNRKFSIETINELSTGRLSLWKIAIDTFLSEPLFGGGFFSMGADPRVCLTSIMPYCCHNTIFQMLGSCGIFGLLSYVAYRIFSLFVIYKNITFEKVFIFISLMCILLMSLLDIHIFDLFGTALYVSLLSLCCCKSNCIKDELKNSKTIQFC